MNKFDITIITSLVSIIVLLAILIVNHEKRSNICEDRGGVYIETNRGNMCAKIERIVL